MQEAARRGIQIKQLVQYVDQLDVHLPQLSVRETLEFAYNNSTVDPSYLGHPDLETSVAARVDNVIKLLGLTGCQNTVVGDELLRGVSGGTCARRMSAPRCMHRWRHLSCSRARALHHLFALRRCCVFVVQVSASVSPLASPW
ncbi:hypothetical protein EON67_05360 [archaeon]|nr:MAG: hypothetical protein EON67_05360 [archaeon]